MLPRLASDRCRRVFIVGPKPCRGGNRPLFSDRLATCLMDSDGRPPTRATPFARPIRSRAASNSGRLRCGANCHLHPRTPAPCPDGVSRQRSRRARTRRDSPLCSNRRAGPHRSDVSFARPHEPAACPLHLARPIANRCGSAGARDCSYRRELWFYDLRGESQWKRDDAGWISGCSCNRTWFTLGCSVAGA
jgi:hypothetical protein